MLIAEDLLLLLTDDENGKLAASSSEVDVAVGGAMLVELTLLGRVDVAGPDEDVRKGRLVVTDRTPTGDALLDEALARVARKEGKKPEDVVGSLAKKMRERLYDRLADQGILREEQGRVLGIFPTTRWPAGQSQHEDAVRTRLESALRNGLAGDPRTGALISLLSALGATHKVVDPATLGLTKHQLKDNAKRIGEGAWASAAVRKAIDSMNAAVAVAATVATTAAVSGS